MRFVGGSYAQCEWKVTDLSQVSADTRVSLLRDEVGEGWTEISCHPAYVTQDYLHSLYLHERGPNSARCAMQSSGAPSETFG